MLLTKKNPLTLKPKISTAAPHTDKLDGGTPYSTKCDTINDHDISITPKRLTFDHLTPNYCKKQ